MLIDSRTSQLAPITSGSDFYAAPAFNSDGTMLAYISWPHPEMPWTRSALYVLPVTREGTNGALQFGTPQRVSTGGKESCSQPKWDVKDSQRLVYLSDKSGFSELYVWQGKGESKPLLKELTGADVGGEYLETLLILCIPGSR